MTSLPLLIGGAGFLLICLMRNGVIRMRTFVDAFDATLAPAAGNHLASLGNGKVERERFTNGDEELTLKIRRLGLPDDAMITVLINGKEIGDARVRRCRARLSLQKATGEAVPNVREGDVVTVAYQGEVLLEGIFFQDH